MNGATRVIAALVVAAALATLVPPFGPNGVWCMEGGTMFGSPITFYHECSGGAENVPRDPAVVYPYSLLTDLVFWFAIAISVLSALAFLGDRRTPRDSPE